MSSSTASASTTRRERCRRLRLGVPGCSGRRTLALPGRPLRAGPARQRDALGHAERQRGRLASCSGSWPASARAHDVPDVVRLALGTGLCGALTTYSTFSYETLRLFEDGARLFSLGNVVLSLAAGLGGRTRRLRRGGVGQLTSWRGTNRSGPRHGVGATPPACRVNSPRYQCISSTASPVVGSTAARCGELVVDLVQQLVQAIHRGRGRRRGAVGQVDRRGAVARSPRSRASRPDDLASFVLDLEVGLGELDRERVTRRRR